jgi:putative membrane protein
MMAWWIFLHTYGGHFSFERAPFDFFNDLFGFERNMFDRFAHFSIGFFAFPIAEYMSQKKLIPAKFTNILFALFSIVTLAAFYELFEWQYAVIFGGESASDFLGSQGDIWDAQKDILMDTLGAVFSVGLFSFLRKD